MFQPLIPQPYLPKRLALAAALLSHDRIRTFVIEESSSRMRFRNTAAEIEQLKCSGALLMLQDVYK